MPQLQATSTLLVRIPLANPTLIGLPILLHTSHVANFFHLQYDSRWPALPHQEHSTIPSGTSVKLCVSNPLLMLSWNCFFFARQSLHRFGGVYPLLSKKRYCPAENKIFSSQSMHFRCLSEFDPMLLDSVQIVERRVPCSVIIALSSRMILINDEQYCQGTQWVSWYT